MPTTNENLLRRSAGDARVVQAALGLLAAPLTAHQTQPRDRLRARAEGALRQQYARTLEKVYLDKGLDVTVTTRCADATTLRIKWVLAGRVTAHQFGQNKELFQTLGDLGFKGPELTDGYDYATGWTF